MLRWHASTLVLHAACVARGDQPVLFVGESGTGKSTMSLTAVERGFTYGGDELTFLDGGRVWGLPRAIHFDRVRDAVPLPPWLSAAAWEPYEFRDREGRAATVPIVPLQLGRVAPAPWPSKKLHLVFPRRATRNRVEPCGTLEALAELHGAVRGAVRDGLEGLVHPERLWRLEWSEPGAALDELKARIMPSA
jgi:hypothetical protein